MPRFRGHAALFASITGVLPVASEKHFDLVVIGGGPGGYVGAIRAAQLGMKTAIVDRDKLGGVCLNWGCIPSKALLHNAELWSEAVTHGQEWGIHFEGVTQDWSAIIERSRSVASKLNAGVGYLMKKNGDYPSLKVMPASPQDGRATNRARSTCSRPTATITTAPAKGSSTTSLLTESWSPQVLPLEHCPSLPLITIEFSVRKMQW